MTDTPSLLLTPDDAKSAIDKKLRANAVADYILKAPSGSPERWKRIFQAWYGLDPNAKDDHVAALHAVAEARANMDDKDYGLTKASRGVAYGEEVNGHIQNALVAIMPEKLKAWLVRFDPYLNKNSNSGAAEQRKAWRQVYAVLHFYRTTNKQRSDF